MIELKLTPTSDTAVPPVYGSDFAACFDLHADVKETVTIKPFQRVLIPTGFIFHIPDGYQMKINPRSGLAWKYGITILNAPATIDSDYNNETFVVLYNAGEDDFYVSHGDRIAQAELVKVNRVKLDSKGVRFGGFGSTGV
jgi:dUTP pyrophosphatase